VADVAELRMSQEQAARFEREALPHRGALLRAAARLTQHAQDAEDLVQETMARACAGFGGFKPGTNVRAWLHRIMMNTFINGYRKRQREPFLVVAPGEQLQLTAPAIELPVSTQSAEDQVLARIPAPEIIAALRELPAEYRLAVYLVDVEGFSYREAATAMGTPLGTVMSRLHRGRTCLRARLTTQRPQRPAGQHAIV
jgi:RNA polymerase sigma-70 factor, ECF subfamily